MLYRSAVFYTYPITYAASFGTESAAEYFGSVNTRFTSEKLFGFIRAQLLNLFLAACPDVFLAIANFGSNATSMVGAGTCALSVVIKQTFLVLTKEIVYSSSVAEFAALQYYWWFMVLFALLSRYDKQARVLVIFRSVSQARFFSSFFQMLMRSADKNGSLEFLENFQKVAKTIPSEGRSLQRNAASLHRDFN